MAEDVIEADVNEDVFEAKIMEAKILKILGVEYCPVCNSRINNTNSSLLFDDKNFDVGILCKKCYNLVKQVGEERKKEALALFFRWRRRLLKGLTNSELERVDGKARVKLTRLACPYCGASDDDVFFHPKLGRQGWIDDQGILHLGSPIYWDVRPSYALCLNCKREFRVELNVTVTITDEVYHEAQIKKVCPRCGYPWFKFGKVKSYREINSLYGVGIIGFRCLNCGESFYFQMIPREAPWKEPHVARVKEFKSRREFGSWQDYRTRFKMSVFGPYTWSKKSEEGSVEDVPAPETHVVRGAFVRLLKREKIAVKKALMERRQIDFEKCIQPAIELTLEKECFSRQKNRIIEETLRFCRYIWLNFSKQGRTSEYIILAVMHFVYALLAQEVKDTEKRESFPLQRFWLILAPNKKFNWETYEKNVDWVLNCLQVAHMKHPSAFKQFMFGLIEG